MSKHLTQSQRYYICLEIANNSRQSKIAKRLGVSRSTVCRELKRNSRWINDYDSGYADKKASLIRSKASSSKRFTKITERMKKYIEDKLLNKWTPEQISGRIKIDIGKFISHETIYKYIKVDKANGGKLFKSLPHKGKKYRYGATQGSTIIGRVDISQRPKIVEKKIRIGDFEIDTIVSAKNTGKSCLLTMVDRKSKLTFVRKTKDKSAVQIQTAIENIYLNSTLPIITLTSDNGTEFSSHQSISDNISCDFYFARPYRSGDRGLNENTNGLIRRYVPKGTNFDTIPEEVIQQIENDLNNRPRKSLKFKTPNEVINKYLQRVSRNLTQRKNHSVAFQA
jgi:transposase, IS30 family